MVESIHADRGVSRVARTPASRVVRPPPPPFRVTPPRTRAPARRSRLALLRPTRPRRDHVRVDVGDADARRRARLPGSLRRAPSSLLVASRRAASPRLRAPPPRSRLHRGARQRDPREHHLRRPPEGDRRRRRRRRPRHGVPPRARRLRRHDPREERGHGRAVPQRALRHGRGGLPLRHRPLPDAPPGPLPRAVHRGRQEPARLHGHSARGPRVQGAFRRPHDARLALRHGAHARAARRRRGGRRRAVHRLARARAREPRLRRRGVHREGRELDPRFRRPQTRRPPRARGEPS